jgi:hypothetical protein
MNDLRKGGRSGLADLINEPERARLRDAFLLVRDLRRTKRDHLFSLINEWRSYVERSAK